MTDTVMSDHHELPVGKVLGAAFGAVFREKFLLGALTIKTAVALLVLTIVLTVILVVFGVAGLGLFGRFTDHGANASGLDGSVFLVVSIVVLIGLALLCLWVIYAFVSLQIAVQREVVLGEELSKQYFGSYPGLLKGRYCFYYFILFSPIWFIPAFIGFGVFAFPFVLIMFLLMPLFARYKLSLTFIAIGRAGSWRESWAMTSGNTMRLWGTDIVVLLLAIGVGVLTSIFGVFLLFLAIPLVSYLTALLAGFEGYILGNWLKHFQGQDDVPVATDGAPG